MSGTHIAQVALQHFRNAKQSVLPLSPTVTVVVGSNGRGKTTVLEALTLLATGESFRAQQTHEMIRLGEEIGRVQGKVTRQSSANGLSLDARSSADVAEESDDEEVILEVTLTRGNFQGKSVPRRLYSVNSVRKQKRGFVGQFGVVVFRPEDMRLIEGSPSRRRQYLDSVLSLTDRTYAQSLQTYEQTLLRRNRLLVQLLDQRADPHALHFWNQNLLRHGEILQEKRRQYCSFFSGVAFPMHFQLNYLPSVISPARMEEYAARERAAGHTLIGPHKDDIEVRILLPELSSEFQPVQTYGSRGQQRLGVLWLKVVELAYVTKIMGERPLLLLDDILSELDSSHRAEVLRLLEHGQSVITTTEDRLLEELAELKEHVAHVTTHHI